MHIVCTYFAVFIVICMYIDTSIMYILHSVKTPNWPVLLFFTLYIIVFFSRYINKGEIENLSV